MLKLIYLLALILLLTAQKEITLDNLLRNPDFNLKNISGVQWTPDGKGYVSLKNEQNGMSLIYYDIKSDKEEVYISANDNILESSRAQKRFSLRNFYWSPANQNHILIPKADDLYLYYKEKKELVQLTNDSLEERDPLFSPDGKKIAYLKNNNLYYIDINTKKETQLTFQGNDKILIGRFDWVYEEEFSIRTGFFWSANSEKIAYFELTDANVDRFPIVDFIPVKNDVEYLPYPKAGADNSTVKIFVTDLNASNIEMSVASNKDELIPRIFWSNNSNELVILKMNRDQDYLEYHLTNVNSGQAKLILKEEEKNGWIDINDDLTFIDKDKLLVKSRRDGYYHLYLYQMNGKLIKQLTKGTWEISQVHGYSPQTKMVYFTAAKRSPLNRELYSVSITTSTTKEISKGEGFHNINMSPAFTFYIDNYSTNDKEPVISIFDIQGKPIKTLIENKLNLDEYANLGKRELIQFITKDKIQLNGYIYKPKNFDPKKKYPVLMFQYSGPGSQSVRNSYSAGLQHKWYLMLNQLDILVFCADGRGTGFRGKAFEQITNHNLGDFETRDQVASAEYLRSLDYVDGNKIAIWGWSYGGYMSSLAITKYPDAFNCAIAVAPVTHWKNYDTIYTERFMSTPDKNAENYEKSSPIYYANQLKNPFLLIHGTADDNVHLSNAVQLVAEFVKHKKQTEHFYYPRSMHGMTYDYFNTQSHLYTLMTNFLLKNFNISSK